MKVIIFPFSEKGTLRLREVERLQIRRQSKGRWSLQHSSMGGNLSGHQAEHYSVLPHPLPSPPGLPEVRG